MAFLRELARGLYSVCLGEERFQRFASPLCRRAHDLLFPVIAAYIAISDVEKPGLIRLTRLVLAANINTPTSLKYRSSLAEIIHRGALNVNICIPDLPHLPGSECHKRL